jgi:hypothetical protein
MAKNMKTIDLNKKADELSKKYGFDVGSILELLMQWGPFLVELILKLMSKTKKEMKSVSCSQDVKDHLDLVIEKQASALAEAVCAKCCLCCDDDEEDDSDE